MKWVVFLLLSAACTEWPRIDVGPGLPVSAEGETVAAVRWWLSQHEADEVALYIHIQAQEVSHGVAGSYDRWDTIKVQWLGGPVHNALFHELRHWHLRKRTGSTDYRGEPLLNNGHSVKFLSRVETDRILWRRHACGDE